jgi:hypothetical protein
VKRYRVKLALVPVLAGVVAMAAALSTPARGASSGAALNGCTVGFAATTDTSSGWHAVGQSFTACGTGKVTSIDIQYSGVPETGKTLSIYDGNGTSGTLLYTQSGATLVGTGFTHIVLKGTLRVAAGHQYTFSVDEGTGIGFSFSGLAGESGWFGDPPAPLNEFPGLSIGHWVHIAKLWKV